MGFRNYLYKLPKHIGDKYRDLTYEELGKIYGDEYIFDPIFDIKELEKIFELGKIRDLNVDNSTFDFFSKYEVSDTEFKIASKITLLSIIKNYENKIINYIEFNHNRCDEIMKSIQKGNKRSSSERIDELQDVEKSELLNCFFEMYNDNRTKLTQWYLSNSYNLDENSDKMTNSNLYEYKIFDLIRIYKDFDFDNNYLLYTGY